ncbi:MAG: thiamine phosphate synthase [Gemmatimonadota bacterium]
MTGGPAVPLGSAARSAAAPAVASLPIPVLHAVTSPEVVAARGFADRARAVMAAGRGRVAVHHRTGDLPTRSLFILAELLAEAQRSTGAWVVVNDRLDVALASGVRGVQLPARSFDVSDARRLVGAALRLGVSVHDAPGAAEGARGGADWLVAGHVYDTPTHAGLPGRGEALVRDVVRAAGPGGPPVIAIGGVTPARVPALRRAGAAGVAAIRGIWAADDPPGVVGEYLSAPGDGDFSGAGPHGQR